MRIETKSKEPRLFEVTLSESEIELLRLALERATFQDTPPQHQRAIYEFSEDLMRSIDKARAHEE